MIQIIPIVVQTWLVEQLYIYFSKRIKDSGSLEESIALRAKFKSLRMAGVGVFFAFNLLLCFILKEIAGFASEGMIGFLFYGLKTMNVVMTSLVWTLMGFTLGAGFYSHREFNPISFITIQDFFRNRINRPFSLYLRGFERDNDSPQYSKNISDGNIISEKLFIGQLSCFFPVYAVGKPQELVSPYGATRIYLDNESWKCDVSNLMKCADSVFILINKRESCIWEIEQSFTVFDKVCYIVDDIEQYREVQQKLKDLIDFPDVEALNISLPFSIRITQGDSSEYDITTHLNPFPNSEKGYRLLIKSFFQNKQASSYSNKFNPKAYILYLTPLSNKECVTKSFESQFINELKKYISIIRSTYEITQPLQHVNKIEDGRNIGSILLKKIQESPIIIVSVENNNSCIQLLKECIREKNKTIFIVNDPYAYKYIRLKYSSFMELPPLDDINSSIVLYYINDEPVIERLQDYNLAPIVYHDKINRNCPWRDIP